MIFLKRNPIKFIPLFIATCVLSSVLFLPSISPLQASTSVQFPLPIIYKPHKPYACSVPYYPASHHDSSSHCSSSLMTQLVFASTGTLPYRVLSLQTHLFFSSSIGHHHLALIYKLERGRPNKTEQQMEKEEVKEQWLLLPSSSLFFSCTLSWILASDDCDDYGGQDVITF